MRMHCFLVLATILALAGVFTVGAQAQTIVAEQWSQRVSYHYYDDRPCGVATDPAGNIYVAGSIGSPVNETDFIVMKYAPNGSRIWYLTYNGPGTGHDYANDMVMDAAGNVYVTGYTFTHGWDQISVFTTLKVNNLGQLQWAVNYTGPVNGWDVADAIALDNQGNVYVTGGTMGATNSRDYTTIKYNSVGVQQWVAYYNGPMDGYDYSHDLAVDAAGNIYVTGQTQVGGPNFVYDYATVKYNNQGIQQWVATYNGPDNGFDNAQKLVLDENSNVYITGESCTPTNTPRTATIKYSSDGVQQWVARYPDPPNADNSPSDLALDQDGNVIVTGRHFITGTPQQFLTIKYSPAGLELWSKLYTSPSNGSFGAGAAALVVDPAGNIYVAGAISLLPDYEAECTVLKYDPQGNQQWEAHHVVDTLQGNDGGTWGRYITLDNSGDVIVAGEFCFGGEVMDHDFITLKLDQTAGIFAAAMTPLVSPIIIPPQGGSFGYYLQAFNNVQNNLATDFWWKAILPTGTSLMLGSETMVLPLDSTSQLRTQRLPDESLAGNYQFILFAGDHPGMIWASDTLLVTKLATGDGANFKACVDDGKASISGPLEINPSSVRLYPSYPNPFNATTMIRYGLPTADQVSLMVYDTAGRLVTTLVDDWQGAGNQQVDFNGSDLPTGLYFYRLRVGQYFFTAKLVLLK